MRLEWLCKLTLRYETGSWHYPYGQLDGHEEAAGFGQGDGTISGEVTGAIAWANQPRRRQDGVWTPNLRGVIRTDDGSEILISIHGQSIQEQSPATHRAILARIELTTEAEAFRWLNTCFIVGEGEIDEEREHWWLDAYVCLNEAAQGSPALGAEPPERYRQPGGDGRR